MSIRISEYQPSLHLRPFVQSYWTGNFNTFSKEGFSRSVVPNGLIELVVHLTDDHCFLTKNRSVWNESPDYTLIGLYKKPYEVRFPKLVHVFGIRFFPEGITNIFGIPPAEFMATYEDSVDVLGPGFRDYCSRLRETGSLKERITLTEQFLLVRCDKNQRNYDYVRSAAELIRRQDGILDQDTLMEQVFVSRRQLQREFKKQIGITVKEYMRLCRLNAVQRYFQGNEAVDFSDLTFEHGFFDQSHFIREFKSFTGSSPGAFLRKRDNFLVNPVIGDR